MIKQLIFNNWPKTRTADYLRIDPTKALWVALLVSLALVIGSPNQSAPQKQTKLREPLPVAPMANMPSARPRLAPSIYQPALVAEPPADTLSFQGQIPGFSKNYLQANAYGASFSLALNWIASCTSDQAQKYISDLEKPLWLTVNTADGLDPLPPIETEISAKEFRSGTMISLSLPLLFDTRALTISACSSRPSSGISQSKGNCPTEDLLFIAPMILSKNNLYLPQSSSPQLAFKHATDFIRTHQNIFGATAAKNFPLSSATPRLEIALASGLGTVGAYLPLHTPGCSLSSARIKVS